MDEAILSSPDPLNDTPTFQSPPKTRRSSRIRRSLPLQESSPSKQTFELDVGNKLSPQKLRVTVEAGLGDEVVRSHFENDRDSSPSFGPTNARREHTTTTTVPLKGLSDSESETRAVPTPKRGRGRPRKPPATAVVSKKKGRASTPVGRVKNRRKSIGDLVDGDDEEDTNFRIGSGVEIGRAKGRSRSRSKNAAAKRSMPASEQLGKNTAVSSNTSEGGGSRHSRAPVGFEVLGDGDCPTTIRGNSSPSETGRALHPIDANAPPSAYSTIRSNTTIGVDEPDVVVARFDPGNETPRRTGWSSPHTVEPMLPSSAAGDNEIVPPSPISSHEFRMRQHREQDIGRNQTPDKSASISCSAISGHDSYDEDRYTDDRDGQLREFDTILEGEGFSMISIESVPSLREHFSSPQSQRPPLSTYSIKNKNLDLLKAADNDENSFSSIPDDILTAATPARNTQRSDLHLLPSRGLDDTFSSIPPRVLEAATPAPKIQLSKFRSKHFHVEDSFSSIGSEILEAATPGRSLPKLSSSGLQPPRTNTCKDPFTKAANTLPDQSTHAAKGKASQSPFLGDSDKSSAPGQALNISPSYSTTTRLLTPAETPSPDEAPSHISPRPAKKNTESLNQMQEQPLMNESSVMYSEMPSSPPATAPRRYTYTAHLRRRSLLDPYSTQTPSIVFSSPSLPPPILGGPNHAVLPSQIEKTPRPELSPIARRGQALQNIVVPSSPRFRSQSLGSPFKSPAAQRKYSIVSREDLRSPMQDRHSGALPRLDMDVNSASITPQYESLVTSPHMRDPFHSDSPQRRRLSREDSQYSLEVPDRYRMPDSRLATLESETGSTESDGAMSWQAEEVVSVSENRLVAYDHDGTSQPSAQAMEDRWAAERAFVSNQIAAAGPEQVVTINSDEEVPNQVRTDEEEDFDLLLKTLNSSSPAAPQHEERRRLTPERPRRSKLPSPWRKNSKRLVYSDELSHLSTPPVVSRVPQKMSAMDGSEPVETDPCLEKAVDDDQINLSDLSGWQIPQKSNFQPRPKNAETFDLSLLLANSPDKRLPVLSTNSQKSIQGEFLPPGGYDSIKVLSTSSDKSDQNIPRGHVKQNSIPQKIGFAPRRSPAKSSTSVGVFGGPSKANIPKSSGAPGLFSSTDRRDPLSSTIGKPLNRPTTKFDQPSGLVHDQNPASRLPPFFNAEKENEDLQVNTMKWTESVQFNSTELQTPQPKTFQVSPTKSCLRSPLKKPSGRSGSEGLSPNKNVQFASSSPIPSPSSDSPLSSTRWSRDHWLLLDSILQSWKTGNTSPSNSNSSSGSESSGSRRRRNSTRVISKLLGKTISSGGEKLKLQQWHLEVVDEFRGKVDGWEEKVTAMRLFALIVGEEKRALGIIGGGSTKEMYHGEATNT